MYGPSKKQNDIISTFESHNSKDFNAVPTTKSQNSTKLIEIMQTPSNLNLEDLLFKIPQKIDKNENIYDLFYKDKKKYPEEKIQKDLLPLNRPNSMKESYSDMKENDKNRKLILNKNENKKNLERMGQQVLNQMNSVSAENQKNHKDFSENSLPEYKENRIVSNKFQEELKTKNIYDNFNQRLDHLDKMKKKYEIRRNFDEKQLISRIADPIYIYNNDLDRYKKALERRVLAAKNNVEFY